MSPIPCVIPYAGLAGSGEDLTAKRTIRRKRRKPYLRRGARFGGAELLVKEERRGGSYNEKKQASNKSVPFCIFFIH